MAGRAQSRARRGGRSETGGHMPQLEDCEEEQDHEVSLMIVFDLVKRGKRPPSAYGRKCMIRI